MRRKKLSALLIFFFVLASLHASTKANTIHHTVTTDQLPTQINVGFLTPMTGALSGLSYSFETGAQLAIKHLNETTSYDWIINFYDTQTSTSGASAAMTSAVNDGSVYVAGAAAGSTTLSAASVAVENQIPLINYASTASALTTYDDSGYLWRVEASDVYQGMALADIIVNGTFPSIGILYIDNSYGTPIADSLEAAYQSLGGIVTTKIPYDTAITDFSDEINQLGVDNPDALVAVSFAREGAILFNQLAEREIDIQVFGPDGISYDGIFNEQDGTQEAMNGTVATRPTTIRTAAYEEFEAAYEAEYGALPEVFSDEAYDAVMAGAKAVMNAGSTSGPDIIAELANLDYQGASGMIKFDDNGDIVVAAYEIYQVQGTEGFVDVGLWHNGNLTISDGLYPSDDNTPPDDNETVTISNGFGDDNDDSTPTSLSLLNTPLNVFLISLIILPLLKRKK